VDQITANLLLSHCGTGPWPASARILATRHAAALVNAGFVPGDLEPYGDSLLGLAPHPYAPASIGIGPAAGSLPNVRIECILPNGDTWAIWTATTGRQDRIRASYNGLSVDEPELDAKLTELVNLVRPAGIRLPVLLASAIERGLPAWQLLQVEQVAIYAFGTALAQLGVPDIRQRLETGVIGSTIWYGIWLNQDHSLLLGLKRVSDTYRRIVIRLQRGDNIWRIIPKSKAPLEITANGTPVPGPATLAGLPGFLVARFGAVSS